MSMPRQQMEKVLAGAWHDLGRQGGTLPCSQGPPCSGGEDNPDCSTQGRIQDFLKVAGDSFFYTAPSVAWHSTPVNASSTGGAATIAATWKAYNGMDATGVSYGVANTIESIMLERVDASGKHLPVTTCTGISTSTKTCSATVHPTAPKSYGATCTTR